MSAADRTHRANCASRFSQEKAPGKSDALHPTPIALDDWLGSWRILRLPLRRSYGLSKQELALQSLPGHAAQLLRPRQILVKKPAPSLPPADGVDQKKTILLRLGGLALACALEEISC